MNIKYILTILNKIIIKKNIILFSSYPPFSDNAMALYQYILNNREDILNHYELIWGQDEKTKPSYLSEKYIRKKSLRGIWTFLRSKYVVTTHSYFSEVKSGNGQIQINLWHGCGYKTLPVHEQRYQGDEFIVTGEIYKEIQAQLFKVDPNRVHVTGLPRNDALMRSGNALIKLGIEKNNYQKIYIWLPTYRKATRGHLEIDGLANSFGISEISQDQYFEINGILKESNELLLIKPHPMDSVGIDKIKGYSNIIGITNEALAWHNVNLYEVLTETDCLWSDYSSVIIDYLMLNKPIVLILSDYNEYKNSRGFLFENISDYFPGPTISCYKELCSYLKHSSDVDEEWHIKRTNLASIFHKYIDGNSCNRVCNLFWGEFNNRER